VSGNHSRDRHGSIFDGAEWDELCQLRASRGMFGSVRERRVVASSTSLVVGTDASSRARRGICMAGPICGTVGLFSVCQGPFSLGNHLHGRRGRGFDAAWWDMSWWVGFLCDKFGFVLAWSVFFGHHHRVGTEADQRGRGGMHSGELVLVESVRGKACCVLASNHTRAGTVPDRRGRCGMNHGTAVLDIVSFASSRHGRVLCVYQPSSCRHGAGSTPAAWDAPRNGAEG
jgi:hypothetical protein